MTTDSVPRMARVLAITCPPVEPAVACVCMTCLGVRAEDGPALDVSDLERAPRMGEWAFGCPCERCLYLEHFARRSADPAWTVVSAALWFRLRVHRRPLGYRNLNRIVDPIDMERTRRSAYTFYGFEYYDRSGWCACARCQRAKAYGDRPLWTAADVARARIFEGAETCPCARCLPRPLESLHVFTEALDILRQASLTGFDTPGVAKTLMAPLAELVSMMAVRASDLYQSACRLPPIIGLVDIAASGASETAASPLAARAAELVGAVARHVAAEGGTEEATRRGFAHSFVEGFIDALISAEDRVEAARELARWTTLLTVIDPLVCGEEFRAWLERRGDAPDERLLARQGGIARQGGVDGQ